MKKTVKILFAVITVICVLSCSFVTFAGSAVKDTSEDISINVTTDKSEYTSNEKPVINYEVTSNCINPDYKIKNLSIVATPDKKLLSMGVKETFQNRDEELGEIPVISQNAIVTNNEVSENNNTVALVLILALTVSVAVLTVLFVKKKRNKTALLLVLAIIFSVALPGKNCIIKAESGSARQTKNVTIMVDGKPQSYTVDVTYDLVINNKVNYYEDNKDSNGKDVRNSAPTGTVYLQNEYIRLGADLSRGGSITVLQSVKGGISTNTDNIVNNYDLGRQIQMSVYSGPTYYYKPNHKPAAERWKGLGWNPIQTGDVSGCPSRILAYYNDGECMYIKLRPMHWPQEDMPAECTFEVLYTLIENSVDVRCRVVNQREDFTDAQAKEISRVYGVSVDSIKNTQQFPARQQEIPAVYVNGKFCNMITYTGMNPFTNESTTTYFDASTPKSETETWKSYNSTEHWMALVNNEGYGLGVYQPISSSFLCGFVGDKATAASTEKDFASGYISPTVTLSLDHNIVWDYNYSLFVGNIKQIRKGVYETAKVDFDDLDYQFTSTSRENWHYGGSEDYIKDKGYGNQKCLEFDYFKSGTLCSPQIFFNTSKHKSLSIDGAFTTADGGIDRIDLQLRMYYGETAADGLDSVYVTVPFNVKGDGVRRIYTIDFEDIYEYQNGLGCTGLSFEFTGDGSAKVYAVKVN